MYYMRQQSYICLFSLGWALESEAVAEMTLVQVSSRKLEKHHPKSRCLLFYGKFHLKILLAVKLWHLAPRTYSDGQAW